MDMGLLYIIIAELFWATEIVIIRKYFPGINNLFIAASGSILGSLFYLPVFFASKQKISWQNWGIMVVYAFTTWFLAQIFYVSGIQKSTNGLAVTLATLSLPFFTFILSALFLKESLTFRIVLGGLFMIIGFIIISFQ